MESWRRGGGVGRGGGGSRGRPAAPTPRPPTAATPHAPCRGAPSPCRSRVPASPCRSALPTPWSQRSSSGGAPWRPRRGSGGGRGSVGVRAVARRPERVPAPPARRRRSPRTALHGPAALALLAGRRLPVRGACGGSLAPEAGARRGRIAARRPPPRLPGLHRRQRHRNIGSQRWRCETAAGVAPTDSHPPIHPAFFAEPRPRAPSPSAPKRPPCSKAPAPPSRPASAWRPGAARSPRRRPRQKRERAFS